MASPCGQFRPGPPGGVGLRKSRDVIDAKFSCSSQPIIYKSAGLR